MSGRPKGNSIFQDGNGNLDKSILSEWKRQFLISGDVTEYAFGLKMCGSWEDYQRVKNNSSILRAALPEWHIELEIKLRSDALRTVVDDVHSGGKTSVSSAKYVLEGQYNKRAGAGRPSKAEIEKEKQIAAGLHEETKQDLERLKEWN